jgi:hypothetical protein
MSNRRNPTGQPVSATTFMIRVVSHDPVELDDHQVFTLFDPNLIFERLRTYVGRTSYMPPEDGPNREVWWSIEWYNQDGKWESMQQGKSRLLKGELPQ